MQPSAQRSLLEYMIAFGQYSVGAMALPVDAQRNEINVFDWCGLLQEN